MVPSLATLAFPDKKGCFGILLQKIGEVEVFREKIGKKVG